MASVSCSQKLDGLTPRSLLRETRRTDLREADTYDDAHGCKERPPRCTVLGEASFRIKRTSAPAAKTQDTAAATAELRLPKALNSTPDPDAVLGLRSLHSSNPPSEVRGLSGRIFEGTSLCNLRPHHQPRHFAILLVEWQPFNRFILLTIIMNCLTTAYESPTDPSGTAKRAFIEVGCPPSTPCIAPLLSRVSCSHTHVSQISFEVPRMCTSMQRVPAGLCWQHACGWTRCGRIDLFRPLPGL